MDRLSQYISRHVREQVYYSLYITRIQTSIRVDVLTCDRVGIRHLASIHQPGVEHLRSWDERGYSATDDFAALESCFDIGQPA